MREERKRHDRCFGATPREATAAAHACRPSRGVIRVGSREGSAGRGRSRRRASSFATPSRAMSRWSDTDFTPSHFASLTSSSPADSGSSSTCDGSPRSAVVQGTTITSSAGLSSSPRCSPGKFSWQRSDRLRATVRLLGARPAVGRRVTTRRARFRGR